MMTELSFWVYYHFKDIVTIYKRCKICLSFIFIKTYKNHRNAKQVLLAISGVQTHSGQSKSTCLRSVTSKRPWPWETACRNTYIMSKRLDLLNFSALSPSLFYGLIVHVLIYNNQASSWPRDRDGSGDDVLWDRRGRRAEIGPVDCVVRFTDGSDVTEGGRRISHVGNLVKGGLKCDGTLKLIYSADKTR